MLSKTDIKRELGKGISFFPFDKERIRANAINLTASKYAWALKTNTIWVTDDNKASLSNAGNSLTEYTIKKNESATIIHNNKEFIVLLPFSTTLIETNEVIALSNYIGGTYHSKVAAVSQGMCHIGTYLEPNYCGHSLIAINSMSVDPILLPVNNEIAAITFYYLKHSVDQSLRGAPGGRIDMLSTLGIKASRDANKFITEQWKNDYKQIRIKMITDDKYISFMNTERSITIEGIKRYLNLRNIGVFLMAVAFLVLAYFGAIFLDSKTGNTIWIDRFWNVGCSGIIIGVLSMIFRLFKT